DYFAPDATTYNNFGYILSEYFKGNFPIRRESDPVLYHRFFSFSGSGWGMYYIVAFLYFFTGQNPVAGNFLCASIGAAAAPAVYILAKDIYRNSKVAKIASLLVAFMPGFINWSSFMLKDGIIIFLLAISMLMVNRLQRAFNPLYLTVLGFSLFGIVALRFYIFPMTVMAIVATFLIGITTEASKSTVLKKIVLFLIIGILITYIGASIGIHEDIQKYGTLERLNNARLDQARTAASGFEEVDVSTAEGIVTILPVGLLYLFLAPFPWQITSIRAALTQPEMVAWWLMIPFLIRGMVYSFRHRLKETMAIMIFTLMLTVGYAIFQGNIGTAYRQRTQIQVFHFIFVAVGWVLTKEKKENEAALLALQQARIMRQFQRQA
ncbi:MAG: phospholipid carrier-dependent glycosyltransferase, partial [Pyrinomonadaceae bacterium]